MKISVAVLSIALAATTACVPGAKFQAGKPIDVEKKALGSVYSQNGQPLALDDMLAKLEEYEDVREDVQSAKSWARGAGILAGIGGFGLGYGAYMGTSGDRSGWTLVGASAGVCAVGFLVGWVAGSRTERAVDAYNRSRAPASAAVVPWIAPGPDGKGTIAMGVSWGF